MMEPSEFQIHCAVADLLRANARDDVVWFHVPNGEIRDKRAAAKLKHMGVLPGVPDFILLLPFALRAMLCFLEIKAGRGGLSKKQADFRERVTAIGCLWSEARSLEAATEILTRWGALKRPARVAA